MMILGDRKEANHANPAGESVSAEEAEDEFPF
jgi:hypothetical protein